MPEYVGIANFRVFFNELAAVVFQAPADLSVSYPVGSLEKVLDVCGMGPEGSLEGLRLGVLDRIEPEFNG
jgi:hypothetical protein